MTEYRRGQRMIKHSLNVEVQSYGRWFVVNRGRIWLNKAGQVPVGEYRELTLSAEPEQVCYLGQDNNVDAYLLINHDQITDDTQWVSARELLAVGERIFELAARAVQVALFLQ